MCKPLKCVTYHELGENSYRALRSFFGQWEIVMHLLLFYCQSNILCSGFWTTKISRETGINHPVKYFNDRSKAVLLLCIIHIISVLYLLCFRASLCIDALWSPAGKGLTSWLSFVMSNCEFYTFPLVSWVRCGTLLHRFLKFAQFHTFNSMRITMLT